MNVPRSVPDRETQLEDILAILAKPLDLNLEEYQGDFAIAGQCFRTLRRICYLNPVIQERLFARLGVLLAVPGIENDKAFAIEAIFTGNKVL